MLNSWNSESVKSPLLPGPLWPGVLVRILSMDMTALFTRLKWSFKVFFHLEIIMVQLTFGILKSEKGWHAV